MLCLFSLAAAGSAQTKLSLAAIRELPGEEIGRGVNQVPSTDLELHTYRVERLKGRRKESLANNNFRGTFSRGSDARDPAD
jgi:hypothetical protein